MLPFWSFALGSLSDFSRGNGVFCGGKLTNILQSTRLTTYMPLSEADTRAKLIDPAIHALGGLRTSFGKKRPLVQLKFSTVSFASGPGAQRLS